MDYHNRNEADHQAYRRRIMKIVDVSLRVPILYFLDGLFSGLWLCCYAKIVGFTPQFDRTISFNSSMVNGTANISLNSNISLGKNGQNFNFSLVKGLENSSAHGGFEIPGFFDALFSWNSGCDNLWMVMSWSTYICLNFVYFFCFFIGVCLFLANNNQLLDCIDWFGPLILGTSSFIWSLLDLMDLAKPIQPPKIYPSIFLVSFITKIVIRLAHGIIASRLYIRARKEETYFYATKIFPHLLLKFPCFVPLILTFAELWSWPGRLLSRQPIAVVLGAYSPMILLELIILGAIVCPKVLRCIRKSLWDAQDVVKNFGIQFLVITHWSRLNIPTVMRVFWLTRVSLFLIYALFSFEVFKFGIPGVHQRIWSGFEYLLVRSCETGVALLGMTSAVSTIGHYVGALFQAVLVSYGNHQTAAGDGAGAVDDEEQNAGSLTGILFIILAVQTGLTELSPQKRLSKLYRNFWLLSMAMMHFVHHMVNNVLLRLSTTGHYKWKAHARAWLVSSVLYIAPMTFIFLIWKRNELWNPWLISVALFAFEVIIKTTVTMKVYVLFMMDTKLSGGLRNLDDMVYFVRGGGAVLEFIFAILLLLNGIFILLFEQSGVVRSFMICVHAYCNIWLQAQEGWASFKRRWHAAKKLDALKTASQEDLTDLTDVCSICYQELSDSVLSRVKITHCHHYFHAACLKKWLYVQDRCPMCHASVITGESTDGYT